MEQAIYFGLGYLMGAVMICIVTASKKGDKR